MTFFNVPNAVQRYPMSPPLSPGENEDADSAKMHQQQSESLTSLVQQQQHSSQDNGVPYGSRPTWCGGREATAFEGEVKCSSTRDRYRHDFEYPAKATAYYGFHGGWADWQQRQQEWDSSYPPPRPQPRPEQYRRDPAYADRYHQAPATPPPESSTAAHCRNGYTQPQTLSTAASAYHQYPLTQYASVPEPGHSSMSGNKIDDAENYTFPKTRPQTMALNASKAVPPPRQLQSVPVSHALQVARVNKAARYNQADFPGAIVVGKTVRIRGGPHENLTGIVKSATKNGATVEVQSSRKTMVFAKHLLELVDTGAVLTLAPGTRAHEALPPPASNAALLQGAHGSGASVVPPLQGPIPEADPQRASPSRRSADPKVYLIARPRPDYRYMAAAHTPPATLYTPRPLLVILDLNGTLLYRKNKGSVFKPRPHLDAFLQYLFSNHVVMVWSSAKPQNVIRMCQKFFSPEQFQRVAAIWSRDHLHLSPGAYVSNTQVYKQLSWVWQNHAIQARNPVPGAYWDQSNTILLDDSVEKSASEPFNLVRIDEFEDRPDQANEDILPQVALYLDTLRSQRNVSAYVRSHPFVPDPSMPRAAAEAFAMTRHAALFPSQYMER